MVSRALFCYSAIEIEFDSFFSALPTIKTGETSRKERFEQRNGIVLKKLPIKVKSTPPIGINYVNVTSINSNLIKNGKRDCLF